MIYVRVPFYWDANTPICSPYGSVTGFKKMIRLYSLLLHMGNHCIWDGCGRGLSFLSSIQHKSSLGDLGVGELLNLHFWSCFPSAAGAMLSHVKFLDANIPASQKRSVYNEIIYIRCGVLLKSVGKCSLILTRVGFHLRDVKKKNKIKNEAFSLHFLSMQRYFQKHFREFC